MAVDLSTRRDQRPVHQWRPDDPASHLYAAMPITVAAASTLPWRRDPSTPTPQPAPDLVLVGGVPGAGKTTAIASATDHLPDVRAVDPEHVSWWLRRRLPGSVPYRSYRWLVHLVHTVRVLVHLLDGPRVGRRLVIHDPGTRVGRRSLFLALAHLAGWRTVLLYVDVDRADAQDGQIRRGRVVRSFDDHWASWQQLRPVLDRASDAVLLVDRTHAAKVLRDLCSPSH